MCTALGFFTTRRTRGNRSSSLAQCVRKGGFLSMYLYGRGKSTRTGSILVPAKPVFSEMAA